MNNLLDKSYERFFGDIPHYFFFTLIFLLRNLPIIWILKKSEGVRYKF